MFFRKFLKCRLEQDVLFELLAPVGAGEEREDRLLLRLGLADCRGEVVGPSGGRLAGREIFGMLLDVLFGIRFDLGGADAFANRLGAGTVVFEDPAHLIRRNGATRGIRRRDGSRVRLCFFGLDLSGFDTFLDHSYAGLVALEDLTHGVAVHLGLGGCAGLSPVEVERNESAALLIGLCKQGNGTEECGRGGRCEDRELIHFGVLQKNGFGFILRIRRPRTMRS